MKKFKFNGWAFGSTIICLMVVLPNLEIFSHLFDKPSEIWYHIKEYLLYQYITTTFKIVVLSVFFCVLIGVSLAYLVTFYDFPGKKFIKWGLILPLAIPAYIGAYTYSGMLSYTGFIQVFLRNKLNMNVNQSYFNIMSVKGTIFIFTLFLFPYVFMITKSFLQKQSATIVESSRLLGSGNFETFYKVILPMSRGAIVGSSTLVAMEVLSDYGVVSYFGVQAFSTAIFKSWISLNDVSSSLKLAGILLITVVFILILEKILRGRKRFSFSTTKIRPITPRKLKGKAKFLASFYCLSIFSLSVIIPVGQMIAWSIASYKNISYVHFFNMIKNSMFLAFLCSTIILFLALILGNYTRLKKNIISKTYSKIAIMGYSMPGTVVAITIILFFNDINNKTGLYLSQSLVMLIFAYTIRYLAIAYQNIESGYEKMGNKFTESSRVLGYSLLETFFKVDLPMLKPAIISAFALTFLDIIKELPLVLLLRPFNFYTLSTKVFEYANDEMIPESSLPSLIIVLISFIIIFILNKFTHKEKK